MLEHMPSSVWEQCQTILMTKGRPPPEERDGAGEGEAVGNRPDAKKAKGKGDTQDKESKKEDQAGKRKINPKDKGDAQEKKELKQADQAGRGERRRNPSEEEVFGAELDGADVKEIGSLEDMIGSNFDDEDEDGAEH